MTESYILSLDQGTTSSRAILFDKGGNPISVATKEHKQFFPQPGWVEHDPMEILQAQLECANKVVETLGIPQAKVAAVGITNQRETTIVWDKFTGLPVHPAIVWQCRRTTCICTELKSRGLEGMIRHKTGLVIDAYFSGSKLKWILDNVAGARIRAERGELLFGTIDTWLIWHLTGGKVHATDYSNASRTMMYNIRELCWDEEILHELGIPVSMLPEVRSSSGDFGFTDPRILSGQTIQIAGVAGDQQAALFGQTCFTPGDSKNTYGTGCFLLMNTGEKLVASEHGLISTIAWGIDGKVEYALEGSIFVGGAVVQWLRDGLGIIKAAGETEQLAAEIEDSQGVYLVPAFAGLGAPYWDMEARGTIVGLTRGTGVRELARAAIEAIAYQTKDVLTAMEQDSGIKLNTLIVDGGASNNGLLMQFQADILGATVERPIITESTALGAAFLAGLAVGFWRDKAELKQSWQLEKRFTPHIAANTRTKLYDGWLRAVSTAQHWSALDKGRA